jgi:hypothetical protein
VDTGKKLSEIELGESHPAMAFADDEHLYLGAESGTLRVLTPDRSGSWNLRNVWQGASALRRIAISPKQRQLVLVNGLNEARVLDIGTGRVSEQALAMPDIVTDIVFNATESRVLLRTPRWLHRAAVSPSGLHWLDAIRAPKALAGSSMVLDNEQSTVAAGDRDGVLVLTRETGFAEVAELRFDYSSGPVLVGNRDDLLAEWRKRLAIADVGVSASEAVPVVALPDL